MQSMPLLLRQSLKSPGFSSLSRTTSSTTAAASTTSSSTTTSTRRPIRIPSAAPRPLFLHAGRGVQTTRGFSVCRRCQFRSQQNLFSSGGDNTKGESNNVKKGDDVGGGGGAGKETKGYDDDDHHHGPSMTLPQEGDFPKYSDVGVEGQKDASVTGSTFVMQGSEGNGGSNGSERKKSRLPSNLENRRSRYSKQFSGMMDNLQSNVFVAGQRLNDLTGYSSIETLKNEIQHQEERLRTARRHVREAKDDYASAINRRSTSQREVNELLQRKHAWSSVDLERFTSLYRNDHTNEVAEHEAQEALSKAEREAEEAAGKLSKNILSRYHEEQVWSDKIRRMSTWGTWGLMGVNVLLFLIFQIGVEPWRRKRLVKGFEEKVIEALEKDKIQGHPQIVTSAQIEDSATPSTATITTTPADHVPASSDESAPVEHNSPTSTTTTTDSDQNQFTLEYVKPHRLFSHITPPSTSIESWRRTLHDLLSDRTFFVTQRDLTAVAIQSAAAGAAVMGLVIALIRPR